MGRFDHLQVPLLATGVVVGLAMAMVSLLAASEDALPDFAVARINDHYILRTAYERAVDAVATDKRDALTDADRRRILDRLVDEELLLQYGLRQGLVRNDGPLRAALVQSVMMARNMEAEASDISEAEARAFFEEHQALFSRTERARVGLVRVPATADRTLEQARGRAREAARLLNDGADFADVQARYHEGGLLSLPDSPLPRGKLVDYLGPTLADVALELGETRAAEPVLMGKAWQVLYVHERVAAPDARYEDVADLVEAEMRRRMAEQSLRRLLDGMRQTESITMLDVASDDPERP
jgi:hypothetical protein